MSSIEPAADRYGARTGTPRWVLPVLLLGAVLAGLLVAISGYRTLGSAPIEAGVGSYEVLSDDAIRIDLQIRRDSPDRAGECIVRSRGESGTEVGRGVIEIPPGEDRVSVTLATTARAVTGEIEACRYTDP